MLRGLLIRQAFVLADWVLVLLIVAGACAAGLRAFGKGLGESGGLFAKKTQAAQGGDAALGALAKLKPRPEYDRIIASNLFGASGKTSRDAQAAPSPKQEETETELRLKLCGTAATTPRDAYASAVILNEDDNSVRTYGLGQSIVEKVTLEEVYPRKVILLNKAANRREVLRSEDNKEADAKAAAGSSPAPTKVASAAPAPGAGNRVSVKKDDLIQDLFVNYPDIVTQIKPELYKDANGNVAGITASNLENLPIAKKLDIHNGDVLQTVNNEVIDSEEKIIELVNKYRNSNTFRIGLLRDGKPVVVTYKLE